MRIRVRFLKLFRSSRLNPSQAEQSVLPHRLYGFLKTDARFSAGAWGEKALEHIEHTAFPVFVGGTGLYLRAFFDGMWIFRPYRMISSRDLRKRAASKARWCCIGN